MKIIEKIFNKLGYYRNPKYESSNYSLTKTEEPYQKNGVWYNVYDNVAEDKDLSDEEKETLTKEANIHFRLAPSEWYRYETFTYRHRHPEFTGHIEGPKHWIGFGSGGGIGKCVYCKCEVCGQIYDITDNTVW